jgi:hypothetical protein
MAFTPATLHLAADFGGSLGAKLWFYDTTDATGDVDAAGYFAGMSAPAFGHRGMEVGDIVIVRIWTTAVPTSTSGKNGVVPADAGLHIVRAISAAGAASVATETAISVASGA